jgi:septum formation protein
VLILASGSPRRHELLLAAGIPHIVRPTGIAEERLANEPPLTFVRRMAEEKARAAMCGATDIVLAADTIVCVDNEVLGKPASDADAARMLRLLSGRDHWVYTGISLLTAERHISDIAATRVSFIHLSDAESRSTLGAGSRATKAVPGSHVPSL